MAIISNNLKKEKLLVLSNVVAMTVTFLLLGAFITLIALTQTAIRNLEKQAQVTLFFKDEFPEQNIKALENEIKADDRVAETHYVSKEDAFNIFKELNKNDPILLESISASILPASLEIKTKDLDDLPELADQFAQVDGVEEVKYFKEVIERFKYWSNVVYTVGTVLVGLFIIISLSVIAITIRININSRGKELEILKLVGASDEYVQKPLVRQGMFFGLISSFLASSILMAISLILQLSGSFGGSVEFSMFPDVRLNITVFTLLLSFVLIAIGFSLSYFGSLVAVRKYLKY